MRYWSGLCVRGLFRAVFEKLSGLFLCTSSFFNYIQNYITKH
jgi:hypothetical protein